jgi:hypothetical protein
VRTEGFPVVPVSEFQIEPSQCAAVVCDPFDHHRAGTMVVVAGKPDDDSLNGDVGPWLLGAQVDGSIRHDALLSRRDLQDDGVSRACRQRSLCEAQAVGVSLGTAKPAQSLQLGGIGNIEAQLTERADPLIAYVN